MTTGLAQRNIDFLSYLPGKYATINGAKNASLDTSVLPPSKVDEAIGHQPALAVSLSRESIDENPVTLATLSSINGMEDDVIPHHGTAVVPRTLAEQSHLSSDDNVKLKGDTYKVRISDDTWLNHQPAVVVSSSTVGNSTMVLTNTAPHDVSNTTMIEKKNVKKTMMAYKAESTSLNSINGALLVITALLSMVFFTMWAQSRKGDIAVLKAVGVPTRAIVIDHLLHSLVMMVIGVVAGGGLAALGGYIASPALSFTITPFIGAMALAIIIAGVIGSAVSLRSITQADPLDALQSRAG